MTTLLLLACLAFAGDDATAASAAPPSVRALPTLPADAPVLERALHAELSRALDGLKLPEAPAPFLMTASATEGYTVNVLARNGAIVRSDAAPMRNARLESHIGSYQSDSAAFDDFGPSGQLLRRLPLGDDELALRRTLWLGLDAAYKGSVEQHAAKNAARRGKPAPKGPDLLGAPVVQTTGPVPTMPAPLSSEALERVATRLSRAARVDPSIEIADVDAFRWTGRRVLLASEQTRTWSSGGWTVVRLTAVARLPDGSQVFDERAWIARDEAALPAIEVMEEEARTMGRAMVALTNASVEENWLGPVVFEGQAAVELFSQLLVPEISGTPPAESGGDGPVTPPSSRIGRRVLPDGWSVRDDVPGHPEALGAYLTDHDGVAPRAVDLVEDGVVRDVLMSRLPRADRQASTGHGRAIGGARREAMPAVVEVTPPTTMAHTRLERQALKRAREVGHDRVLVVTHLSPAANDGIGLSVTGGDTPAGLTSPTEAHMLYRDGRRVPVRGLHFSGVDRRTLRDIVATSPGEGWTTVMDSTAGPGRYLVGPTGGLPVTWNVPNVLVAEMELLGSGGGEPRVIRLTASAAGSTAAGSAGTK